MANVTQGSVIVVDTTGYTGVGTCTIVAVKYIGAASGTATISSGGTVIWEQAGTANVLDYFDARVSDIVVTLGSTAKVYIYTAVK
jgi:hypothetical protein